MSIYGTGWSATKRTTGSYGKNDPQLQVVGSKVYYVWREYDGSNQQIWTAEMSIYGAGWSATKRTYSSFHKYYPELQVVGSKIYYVWYEPDGSYPCRQDRLGFFQHKQTAPLSPSTPNID